MATKQPTINLTDDKPILQWEIFRHEIHKFYKKTHEVIPELSNDGEDWAKAADAIFEQMIIDYSVCKQRGVVDKLNYKLAEA